MGEEEMGEDEMRDDEETTCEINQSLNLPNAISSIEQVTFLFICQL